MFSATAGTSFEIYVYSKKEKGRVGRLATSQVSQKDDYVGPFAGTS